MFIVRKKITTLVKIDIQIEITGQDFHVAETVRHQQIGCLADEHIAPHCGIGIGMQIDRQNRGSAG